MMRITIKAGNRQKRRIYPHARQLYEEPELCIFTFLASDIITASKEPEDGVVDLPRVEF